MDRVTPTGEAGREMFEVLGARVHVQRSPSTVQCAMTQRLLRAGHGDRRSPRGIVYPMLLGAIMIIGIATAGVAELWTVQVKREKEAELLFRLGEYRRAIIRYRADHNRLPKELKDLLEDRTQLQTKRYLRRLYPDPMTGKADWKLKLVVDRAGVVSGIEDVNSTSADKPLRTLPGKKAENSTYKDW